MSYFFNQVKVSEPNPDLLDLTRVFLVSQDRRLGFYVFAEGVKTPSTDKTPFF